MSVPCDYRHLNRYPIGQNPRIVGTDSFLSRGTHKLKIKLPDKNIRNETEGADFSLTLEFRGC